MTTRRQFEVLIAELEQLPELARGGPTISSNRPKLDKLDEWSQIAKKLNAYGPPHRTVWEWKKTWFDLKSRTKKKLKESGGDPLEMFLNRTERCVAKLIRSYETSKPQEHEKSNDSIRENENKETQSNETEVKKMQSNEVQTKKSRPKDTKAEGTKSTLPILRRTIEQERFEALKQQTIQQAEILQTLKNIEKIALENCEIKKQKLLLYENQCDTANELHSLEVEYKRKKLQLLEAQLAKYQ